MHAPGRLAEVQVSYADTYMSVHTGSFGHVRRSGPCVLLAVPERAVVTPERALDRAGVDRVDEVNLLTKSIESSTG